MKITPLPLIMLICLFTFTTQAKDGHYTEYVGASGKIDWTNASVSAIGYGVAAAGKNPKVAPLLACRAAIVDAQRNLLESFYGVRVTATTLVSNYMLTSDEVKSSVEGTVKGAIIKSRINRVDGSCKVELQAPLRGKAANSIYKNLYNAQASNFNFKMFFSDFISTAHAASLTIPLADNKKELQQQIDLLNQRVLTIEESLQSSTITEPKNLEISGIVIDVRGSLFIPSLDPKIRKSSGEILYPSVKNASQIIDRGQLVSLFSNDVNFALEHPLVGDNPLLIKAQKTWSNNPTEIALSGVDAEKMGYLVDNNKIENIGVIIVLE